MGDFPNPGCKLRSAFRSADAGREMEYVRIIDARCHVKDGASDE